MERKRTTKVVNPSLQYREAMIAAAVVVISVNLLIAIGTLLPGKLGVSFHSTPVAYWSIAVLELILLVAVWLLSIRRSHAVAGPVYAMVRELSKLSHGDLSFSIRLRPGDELQREAQQINAAADRIRQQVQAIKQRVAAMEGEQSVEELQRHLALLSSLLAELKTEARDGAGRDGN